MITERDTIKCEAIFNDERTHRFLWKRIWNKDKPIATIIMLNPCMADNIITDTTTCLVVNNIARLEKYGGVTAAGLAESGVSTLRVIEDLGYDKLVVSIKSSNVKMNYDAHMILKDMTDYPIHIGITESGTPRNGIVKSVAGIGSLLLAGVGDTMRVSLTDNPVNEVVWARRILETVGMRQKAIEVVSCPTCGRTEIDLIGLANEAEDRLQPIAARREKEGKRPLKIAVMGCAVNGPGESREADYGIAGGRGEGLVFARGEILKKVREDELIDELIRLVEND